MALDLPRAQQILEQGVRDGLHYGAQLSVVFRGQCIDICVGEAAPGVPMTSEHVLHWSSSVKPVLSLALGRLYEKGLVDFETPVAKYLPSFAVQGKGSVTLAHCLTHTAGLWAAMRGEAPVASPPAQVAVEVCDQPLAPDWVPGKRCAYDGPAWYIGAAVVAGADPQKRAYDVFVEEEIFGPLGLSSCSVGMSAARYACLHDAQRLSPLYDMSKQGRAIGWKPIPDGLDPRHIQYPCPAGNGRGPARELAALYAALLPLTPGGGDGEGAKESGWVPILQPDTIDLLTRTAREGIEDELQGTDTAWSLGFALRCILSGKHASTRAFGHGGSQSSWAFADPEHGLAAACICNGKPGPEAHYRRVGGVSTAVYEDLGLVPESRTNSLTFKLPMGLGTF
eukprot:CAMPEP_0203842244 /NCGR_PEP_ID=MMETSP0359-20131031/1873_1 /ASSEMBLY_ACC=CAM_ASM_000338 /TAXON_ID=268821 /ORGANISM="Scrippsiella Hangoei, Strain SHTV-5" /LENGTH=394 /DNA_ID=CAMNT_0050756799 /DNA_START=33 /DNA_END=1217 /DNA_ORIENTATION=+